MIQLSDEPLDSPYSHWYQTGAAPAKPSRTSPLDSAIGFEHYRLTVVSRWPEGAAKQDRLRSIQSALHRLELEHAELHQR